MHEILDFLLAMNVAQEAGNQQFVCPACGRIAKWSRSEENGHIRASCECGISVIE